ncbi:MAG: glycoside hydrolase 43 family protein [Nibricoccus sp.]
MIELKPARGHEASQKSPATGASSAPWTADLGDGTYRNPVLFADYSDPDVVRVGDDYWMTSSSFCHVPGLPILHSRDLVNWTLVNHALPRLVPVDHFRQPRHGEGVWAPSIRHHAGKFWIFYPDPDFGIYFLTATDPRGQWSEPSLIKGGKGLIDPCPLWDDNGDAYLVHGWAKSRAGVCNRLTVHRIDPATARILDAGMIVIDGDQMPGWKTIEGPKFYKRNGWYYIFAPAGGVAEGYQAVFRSRDIFGPYESRIVLEQGGSSINGPHQGALVDTPGGEHWFFHFQEVPAYGRIVHLQPVTWRADDWPAMGINRDASGKGEPTLTHKKPALPLQSVTEPATSDEFTAPALGHQWQWQGNPQPHWYTLTAKSGALRLACVPVLKSSSHWQSAHLLMQKFPAPAFTATTRLTFSATQENDTAGLIVFGYDYAWIGLRNTAAGLKLIFSTCINARDGGTEKESDSDALITSVGQTIHLRVRVEAGALCHFSHSLDGKTFLPLGKPFRSTSSKWVGAKVGLFASSAVSSVEKNAGQPPVGHADFTGFQITP